MLRSMLGLFIIGVGCWGSAAVPNFQLDMVSTRFAAIGGENAAVQGDTGGIFINPSTIAYNQTPQLFFSSRQLYNAFDYVSVAYSRPYQSWHWGVSAGSVMLDDIIKTKQVNDRIQAMASFSSGYHIMQGTIARTVAQPRWGLRSISWGINGKLYQQTVDSDSRSGYGFDVGVQATTGIQTWGLEQLDIGASLINVMSQLSPWKGHDAQGNAIGGSTGFKQDRLVGFRGYHMNRRLQSYVHQVSGGMGIGAEYHTNDLVVLRAGKNTAVDTNQIGFGLIIDDLINWGKTVYTMRFDYTYGMHANSGFNDHAFSISLMGDSKRRRPTIVSPRSGEVTSERQVILSGYCLPNSDVLVYNQGSLMASTHSTARGDWALDQIMLREGDNRFQVKAYTQLGHYSDLSDPVHVVADFTPPDIHPSMRVADSQLNLIVRSNEPLSWIDAEFVGEPIIFQRVNHRYWEAVIPWNSGSFNPDGVELVPGISKVLTLTAMDTLGNATKPVSMPLFFQLNYPKHNQVVYQRFVNLVGQSSALVKRLVVNNEVVPVDSQHQFEFPLLLQPGQNKVMFHVELHNGQVQQYYMMVNSMRTFSDLFDNLPEKLDIEALASIGVLTGEKGLFGPEKTVNRRDFVRLLVKLNQLPLSGALTYQFRDVDPQSRDARVVQSVIQRGWMQGTSANTFSLNRPITEAQAWTVFQRADMVEGDAPMTLSRDPLKRKRLATLLVEVKRLQGMLDALEASVQSAPRQSTPD